MLNRTRVAIVGLGGAAERILLPGLTTLAEVDMVAGCDSAPSARERGAKRWNIPRTYNDAGHMFDRERPEVAVIATPPLTHPELCLLALEHGCHVFCEKPFMPSLETADQVIDAAKKKGRIVAVNNQYYQMPIFRAASQLLQRGEAGRLYFIDVWQRMYLPPEQEGGWKAELQQRRVLYEFGTHALDLICQFFGSYPISVSTRVPRVARAPGGDVLVIMRLDFPQERVANIVLNRVSRAPMRYLDMRLECEEASLRVSLGGVACLELGWNAAAHRPGMRFSLTRGGEARVERDGRSRLLARQPLTAYHEAAAAHFSQFLSAIRDGREPALSAVHARDVLKVVFAGYQSASEDGALVKLK
jgi:predicted dehydrogenase